MLNCATRSTLIGTAAYLHFCADRNRASRLLTAPWLALKLAAIWLDALIPLAKGMCSTCDAICRLNLMLEVCDWCRLFGLSKSPRQTPQSSLSAALACNGRHVQCAAMYTLKARHVQLCLLLHCCCMYNDKSDGNDICTVAIV